jgi:transposase
MNCMAAANKYPVELKERAVAMVRDLEKELGPGDGAIARVARILDINSESLRYWVKRDEEGQRPSGLRVVGSDAEREARIKALEQENKELRRANDILKAASAFFAQEMNPRPPR